MFNGNQGKYLYDALLVLGAVMEYDQHRQIWDFPAIVERYAGKLVMGKVRAFATMLLQEITPLILITGGSDTHPETGEVHSRSVELAKLITGVYGVPSDKVVPMGTASASHTLGNAENLVEYIEAHPDKFPTREIAVLCPWFQFKRAKMMFECNTHLAEEKINLTWQIAEDVIKVQHHEMKEYFEWIYSTEQAKICEQMEEKGIADLRSGGYKPKT